MIVDFQLSEEQQLIEDSISGLLAERLPVERLRETGSHFGAAEHRLLPAFAELGLFGLAVPEAQGGIGLGIAEEALAAKALGRHLASPSLLAQMVAPHLAEDNEERATLIAGASSAAFANRLAPTGVQLFDAGSATRIVLLDDGARLIATPASAESVDGLDEAVAMARGDDDYPAGSRNMIADRISLLFAAYLAGIAQATLEMAVAYAGTREQFGQPIGAFQAIKHQCADMAVRAAAAEAQVLQAAITFGAGGDDRAEAAAARLLATDAALANAKANIQIHGGMGFTAECDAHLFLKRAHLIAALGSSKRAEQARLLGSEAA